MTTELALGIALQHFERNEQIMRGHFLSFNRVLREAADEPETRQTSRWPTIEVSLVTEKTFELKIAGEKLLFTFSVEGVAGNPVGYRGRIDVTALPAPLNAEPLILAVTTFDGRSVTDLEPETGFMDGPPRMDGNSYFVLFTLLTRALATKYRINLG